MSALRDPSESATIDIAGPDQGLGAALLLAGADTQAGVHQAMGMISVQCCCGTEAAADLLAARAFADGQSLVEIAQQVVHGQQLFLIGKIKHLPKACRVFYPEFQAAQVPGGSLAARPRLLAR